MRVWGVRGKSTKKNIHTNFKNLDPKKRKQEKEFKTRRQNKKKKRKKDVLVKKGNNMNDKDGRSCKLSPLFREYNKGKRRQLCLLGDSSVQKQNLKF